jgi:malate/lactate dehydrogenase
MISGKGVEKIIEIPLSDSEKQALAASAGRVQELIGIL